MKNYYFEKKSRKMSNKSFRFVRYAGRVSRIKEGAPCSMLMPRCVVEK